MPSFLEIPAELRLKVYSHIALPYNAPQHDYSGFYLSCKQIKNELDHEAEKALEDLNKIPNVSIAAPYGFLAKSKICVTIDDGFYGAVHESATGPVPFGLQPVSLCPILDLHFAVVSLRSKGPDHMTDEFVTGCVVFHHEIYERPNNAQEIAMELEIDPVIDDSGMARVNSLWATATFRYQPTHWMAYERLGKGLTVRPWADSASRVDAKYVRFPLVSRQLLQ